MHEMVKESYQQAQRVLMPLGLSVTRVVLDERRALKLELNHGLEVVLGRQDKAARLQRFVRVYPKVMDKIDRILRVDLRYPHGLTVEWKPGAGKTES